MKKLLLIFIIIIPIVFVTRFYWEKAASKPPASENKVLSANEAPTPTPRVWKQSTVIDLKGTPIRVSWAIVNPKGVELYDNLNERKLSEEIKVNKSCSVLVNGGFYAENQTHLGLFVSNFKEIAKFAQSATRNGFLSIDSADKVFIGANSPNNNPRIALQSGPLLIQDNQQSILSINNDEPGRRIVAGITNNQLIFLVFYREKADFEGPLLQEMPEAIGLFEKQTGIEITDAINLDGGKHSIFVSDYDLLRELEIVGSYFCAK